ncbi:DUF349 domain-containing protein [Massilia sp. DWR3-1-1]|uniref:DUF349 domain-containing protein n=1 Tax=Massilia sp. DWR3-1-1 TaxID=2804559 RepID=UPI003CEF1FE1
MLKFLFKRPGDKSTGTPAENALSEQKAAAAAATASTTAQRAAQAEQLRALGTDEVLAADFIVQSDFSELRLAAAELLRSRPQLERVHAAIRNTDRRVAKLVQGRLDAIRHHDAELARGQACLEQAASLLADDKLTPNQVADLDRRWAVIAAPELRAPFDALRERLGARLASQVALQRAMIDRLAALRVLTSGAFGSDAIGAEWARMAADQQAALGGPEHASLPRALTAEVAVELARVQAQLASLEQGRSALAARAAALEGWAATLAAARLPVQPLRQGASEAPADAAPLDAAPTAAQAEEVPAKEASAEAAPTAAPAEAAPADAAPLDAAPTAAQAEEVPAKQAPAEEAPAAAASDKPETAPAAPAHSLSVDLLKREWQRLPTAPAGDAADALQERFETLLATLARTQPKGKGAAAARADHAGHQHEHQGGHSGRAAASPATPFGAGEHARPARGPRPAGAADPLYLDHLAAMESALEQGSLHSAAEYDKALKDMKGGKLNGAQAERLAHARAELKRLSDWARWGGNVSREELIKAVEQLRTQSLPMAELAKKVGSMRERWKALDTLSGAAPKSLWERFDAACSGAYAPAAAHFKQLAEERHNNAARAQALIDEASAQAANIEASALDAASTAAIDWKQMAATVQRLRLAWSHLGAIDRKDKKQLDQQFAAALNIMQRPLEQQRKTEVGHREELIEQVASLDPAERGALDALRAAQERWQELARALPLERKAEQALWHRFRTACDAVFAKRKESASAADGERRAHQAAKDAISARLEDAAATIDAAGARKLLQEAASQWQAIGAVPRAAEAKIEQRYHAALGAVQAKIDDEKRAASIARASALRDKLRLCQQLEVALGGADGTLEDGASWQARWAALPPLAPEFDKALATRFQAALAALAGDRAAYVRKLEQNRPILLQEVLRQEIAAGIDSGSEFARERLKLQVEVLQSSLKSGQKGAGQSAQFEQLAAMPALADERTASRIEQLFARVVTRTDKAAR